MIGAIRFLDIHGNFGDAHRFTQNLTSEQTALDRKYRH